MPTIGRSVPIIGRSGAHYRGVRCLGPARLCSRLKNMVVKESALPPLAPSGTLRPSSSGR
jgi:hypothetical protein